MKNNDTQKITTLGVVIFSFFGIAICMGLLLFLDAVIALIVAKTPLPEGVLKIANVINSCVGIITGTAIMTAVGKMKGILSAVIMTLGILIIKILGNALMNIGGYFGMNGFIGLCLLAVFAFAGGVLGTALKR